MFVIVFVQQLTLILELIYWDPTKSDDFKE